MEKYMYAENALVPPVWVKTHTPIRQMIKNIPDQIVENFPDMEERH